MRHLPDTELEVMKALWAMGGEAVTRSDLEARLGDLGWATNTFNTYLSRLTDKGFIPCEKRGKTNRYAIYFSGCTARNPERMAILADEAEKYGHSFYKK